MQPNTTCIVCDAPLYRTPKQLAKIRYATCSNAHRHEAASIFGPSPATQVAFKKGRVKGHTRREGTSHTEDTRQRMAESQRKLWAATPGRGKMQARGAGHYKWKGGITPLTVSIRVCAKSLYWYKQVKRAANFACEICSTRGGKLEAHHKRPFAYLMDWHQITSLEAAQDCRELFDLNNGMCLCQQCHAGIHGKKFKGSHVDLFVYPTMFLKETDYE